MSSVTITTINDGPRNIVLHIAITGDAGGDLTDEDIIDPANDDTLPDAPTYTVSEIWYDLVGFDGYLEFDYLTADTPLWTMSSRQSTHINFECFGGLKDRSDVMDGTGKLQLTTSGIGAGDLGTIIVKLRKD